MRKLGVSQADIDEFRSIMLTSDIDDAIENIYPDDGQETTPSGQSIADESWYDLSGRKCQTVNAQWPTLKKGIYIRNGKKFILR